MAMSFVNSIPTNEKGAVTPCHRPYQKPTGVMVTAWRRETLSAHPERSSRQRVRKNSLVFTFCSPGFW